MSQVLVSPYLPFADYKERVIDLLLRVTAVSVRTVEITKAMERAARS